MDGPHDLGGTLGHGPVQRDEPAQPLAERWHGRVFAMMRTAFAHGVARNTDQFRHAIERLDSDAYFRDGYYGRWLSGLETLWLESGTLSRDELDRRTRALGGSARSGARPAANPDRIDYAPDSASASRALTRHCAFALGDRVRTRADAVPGHTRLPSYARDQFGTVVALHDGWVFPDDNAHGRGENPQHLLTVRFRGESLWGPDAEPGVEVNLDLFESYLIKEPA